MVKERIQQIKTTEAQAHGALEQARAEAQRILDEGRKEALALKENASAQARAAAQKAQGDAESQAQEEICQIHLRLEKEKEALSVAVKRNHTLAQRFVIARIIPK